MHAPTPELDPTQQPQQQIRAQDPEVVAIGKVCEAVAGLEPDVQQRVIRWAADKFKVAHLGPESPRRQAQNRGDVREEAAAAAEEVKAFNDFSSFYDAADPQTESQKALVAGYWLQQGNEHQDWTSQAANKELKNLGHGIANITGAFDDLIGQRPRLVIQTRKEGTSKQARKKYKVTGEGIKAVKQLLAGTAGVSENGG